jgi:beta-phosphoglucomutase-like phosphatase (HAD superfamily)
VTLRRERFAALLFDVDGTLAETEELHRRAFNDSFAYFGLPWVWDFALYRELLRVTGGQERIRHFLRTFATSGDDLSDAEVAELHRFKTARYASLVATGACELRPGVADVIRRASGS